MIIFAIAINPNLMRFGISKLGTLSSRVWIRGTHTILKYALASGAKSFDREDLSLLHFGLIIIFDERDLLSTVDVVTEDVMAGNISDCFDRVRLPTNFDLIGLHCLLNSGSDFTHASIDAGAL
jgi:hypothetical protein